MAIRNTLHPTKNTQRLLFFGSFFPLAQLSYSHMQPMGWMHMTGPRRAPMSETSASKTGIVLAMMYAMSVIPKVQPSQTAQWIGELEFRCREPRRMWTKMNFEGI